MVTGTFTYPAQRASRLDPIEVLRRGSWPCRRNSFRASREAGSSSRRLRFAFGDGHQASPPNGATGDVEQVLAAVSDTPLTDGDDVIDVLGLAGWWTVPEISTPWWYITRPDQMHTIRLIIENRSTEKICPIRLVIAREYFRLRVISFGFSRPSWTRDSRPV
jgi:hypothetical protein